MKAICRTCGTDHSKGPCPGLFASTDEVNHPSHYNQGKIEVIEAIEDWKLGFHLGNAVKYIARAGRKSPDTLAQDLEKAIWYIRRHVEISTEKNPRRPNEMPQPRMKK